MSIAVINAKIDTATKQEAQNVLRSLGLNMSQAITLFLRQVVYTHSIPFELKLPNETTLETFRKTDAGKDLHRVSDVKQLAQELKS